MYASTAALLSHGHEFKKHSAVLAAVNTHFVATGRMDKSYGRDLRWLFELRGVGDDGMTIHISADDASQAIETAGRIVAVLKAMA